MSDHTAPISFNINVFLWKDCQDNEGNKYSLLLIEQTPRRLWDFIPLKEKIYIKPQRVFIKNFEFRFKRKTYKLEFLRAKEAGES